MAPRVKGKEWCDSERVFLWSFPIVALIMIFAGFISLYMVPLVDDTPMAGEEYMIEQAAAITKVAGALLGMGIIFSLIGFGIGASGYSTISSTRLATVVSVTLFLASCCFFSDAVGVIVDKSDPNADGLVVYSQDQGRMFGGLLITLIGGVWFASDTYHGVFQQDKKNSLDEHRKYYDVLIADCNRELLDLHKQEKAMSWFNEKKTVAQKIKNFEQWIKRYEEEKKRIRLDETTWNPEAIKTHPTFLPDGWTEEKDAAGKTYYWRAKDKKSQHKRPLFGSSGIHAAARRLAEDDVDTSTVLAALALFLLSTVLFKLIERRLKRRAISDYEALRAE